jgi:hypothetical protein
MTDRDDLENISDEYVAWLRSRAKPQPPHASHWQSVRESCSPDDPTECRYPWCGCEGEENEFASPRSIQARES